MLKEYINSIIKMSLYFVGIAMFIKSFYSADKLDIILGFNCCIAAELCYGVNVK